MKVFLGGTLNGSRWRDELIPKLHIDYFNPLTDEWDEDAQSREEMEKESSDFLLFFSSFWFFKINISFI